VKGEQLVQAQRILQEAQEKHLAAEAVFDELTAAKAQVQELQEREKMLSLRESEGFSVSSVQPDMLQEREKIFTSKDDGGFSVYSEQMRKTPAHSHGASSSRTSGSAMSNTRAQVDATIQAGGVHAEILKQCEQLFPFTSPSQQIIESTRKKTVWHPDKSRRLEKQDKLLQRRSGLYYNQMLKLATGCMDIIPADKNEEEQREILENFLVKVFKDVTSDKDGRSQSLTETKSYILTTMVEPEASAISELLNLINTRRESG